MADSRQIIEQIAGAAAHIDPRLSDQDIDRLVHNARGKRRRRVVSRVGLAVVLAGAGLLVGLRGLAPDPAPQAVAEHPQESQSPLHLADGSIARPLDLSSRLVVRENSPRRVALALERGRARFEGTPRAERAFVVNLGEVTVTVMGTVFTVERVADRIGVAVERGRVRVDWKIGEQVLQAGESGWFPPVQIRTPPEPPAVRMAHTRQAAKAEPPAPIALKPSPAASDPPVPAAPGPSAEDLLAAADAARGAGRRAESARLLSRLLREHRDDARAPLAGFTLGRILLMEMARPREAAQAFAEVRALAPTGPFAEDALAREAEAWHKAGDSNQASARAQEYLRLYPHGRRFRTMQGLLGKP
jgi:hypothetical protein